MHPLPFHGFGTCCGTKIFNKGLLWRFFPHYYYAYPTIKRLSTASRPSELFPFPPWKPINHFTFCLPILQLSPNLLNTPGKPQGFPLGSLSILAVVPDSRSWGRQRIASRRQPGCSGVGGRQVAPAWWLEIVLGFSTPQLGMSRLILIFLSRRIQNLGPCIYGRFKRREELFLVYIIITVSATEAKTLCWPTYQDNHFELLQ